MRVGSSRADEGTKPLYEFPPLDAEKTPAAVGTDSVSCDVDECIAAWVRLYQGNRQLSGPPTPHLSSLSFGRGGAARKATRGAPSIASAFKEHRAAAGDMISVVFFRRRGYRIKAKKKRDKRLLAQVISDLRQKTQNENPQ
jgi:hypothetical protein